MEVDGHLWGTTVGLEGEDVANAAISHYSPSDTVAFAGDFNEVLFAHEKEGGRQRSQRSMDVFREALEECGVEDLGYEGDMFTWRNNQFTGGSFIRERLDRAVANTEWRALFPEAQVVNGESGTHVIRITVLLSSKQSHLRCLYVAVEVVVFSLRQHGLRRRNAGRWSRVPGHTRRELRGVRR
jgi:hypothetical protein